MGGRKRRSKEQARMDILTAAEARLAVEGPDGVRLQKVAEDVGLSHPGVLHHFPSRGDLLEAVYRQATESLRNGLLEALAGDDADLEAIADRLVDHLARPRHRRLLAWLLAAGRDPFPAASDQGIRKLAERVHLLRQAKTDRVIDLEETISMVLFVAAAAYGDALVGAGLRKRMGLQEDASTRKRIRGRIIGLLATHFYR